jgi:hypothetical protein
MLLLELSVQPLPIAPHMLEMVPIALLLHFPAAESTLTQQQILVVVYTPIHQATLVAVFILTHLLMPQTARTATLLQMPVVEFTQVAQDLLVAVFTPTPMASL